MHTHRLCDPRPQRMEIRPTQADRECPCCHAAGSIHGNQCRSCGVFIPSANSWTDPRRSKHLKKNYYSPKHDGINDAVPDDQDELSEYSDLLEELHVDLYDEQETAESLPPSQQELEDLPPWS